MELERFITSVKSRPSIWDQRQSDHHNRYVLDRLWKEVTEENNCTVKDGQSKWKSLRDYYRKEFRKTHLHRPGYIYISNWPYFKLMDFLKDQFIPQQSSGNLKKRKAPNDSETTEGSTGETAEELDWDSTSQNGSTQELSITGTTDRVQSPQVNFEGNMATLGNATSSDANAKKSKIDHLRMLINIENRKVSILEQKMTKSKDDIAPDEDQSFFASVLPHVRNIKGVNKILFRNEIQKLIIKYAYSDCVTPNYVTSSGSTPTDSSLHSYSTAGHPHTF